MIEKYKPYAYKLNNKTASNLKKQKIKSGKTWNLFFVDMLKAYGQYVRKTK